MSLLQNEEFIIYNLRTSYLSHITDGVGERLITVNQGVFNTPGFRAAGWQPSSAEIKRTYSPPIPTAIASEYFQAPPRSAGLPLAGFGDDEEEGGMVTGAGGSGDTVGPALNTRRRRRKEQMEEEDSSDLSDESDEDGEGMHRAAQQIKFAKMPVRMRSGSSPIRKSNSKDGTSVQVAPSSRPSEEGRLRRGSLGAVEAIKERARRGTATSSEISSDAEMDQSTFSRRQLPGKNSGALDQSSEPKIPTAARQNTKESTELEDEDSDGGSEGSSMSSEFAETGDSPSILDQVSNPLESSPLSHLPGPAVPQNTSPKKTRSTPATLQALPPPRPISTVQPVSALSLALQAKRSKAASPFERFATLSGKGDPNPLNLKIYAPFSDTPNEAFEVPIHRLIREDNNPERKVTVVDTIGLSLWRYAEESLKPPIPEDKSDVNRWTLRMVEDGEVDYDFPALDRTKAVNDFASNNTRAARMRSTAKVFDEFALVEATQEQFLENERLTPNPPPEPSSSSATVPITSAAPEEDNDPTPQPSPNPGAGTIPRHNPVLGPTFAAQRNLSITPADLPAAPASYATPRTGPSKILKIHLSSPEGYPQLVAVDVTTDTYLAEVLDMVCRKRNLDKAQHMLKLHNANVVAPLDRTVESLGERDDIDLIRRRFGLGAALSVNSPDGTPPNAPILVSEPARRGAAATHKKQMTLLHPLSSHQIPDMLPNNTSTITATTTTTTTASTSSAPYKRWTVWRKQPMSFMPTHERILAIDGDYLHLMPGETGRSTIFDTTGAKTTTIHFSSIVGCKCSRKHPSHFRVVVYKSRETKRYDFEATGPDEAAEIVDEVKRGMERFQEMGGV